MRTRNHTLATLAVVAWVHSFREAAKSLSTWAEKKGLADMYLDVDHVMQLLTAMDLRAVPVLSGEGCLPDPIEGLVKAKYMVLTEFRADDISPIAYCVQTVNRLHDRMPLCRSAAAAMPQRRLRSLWSAGYFWHNKTIAPCILLSIFLLEK